MNVSMFDGWKSVCKTLLDPTAVIPGRCHMMVLKSESLRPQEGKQVLYTESHSNIQEKIINAFTTKKEDEMPHATEKSMRVFSEDVTDELDIAEQIECQQIKFRCREEVYDWLTRWHIQRC